MNPLGFAKKYFVWHYGRSLGELWEIEKNFLWFGYHFFSLPLLVKTFFAPIYRIREDSPHGFDMGALTADFIITSIMRLVGVIVRIPILAAGIIFEIILGALFLPAFVLWLTLPFLAAGMLAAGIIFLGLG